jgi:hypothetical protein
MLFRRKTIVRKEKFRFNEKELPQKMLYEKTYGISPKLIQSSALRTRPFLGGWIDMILNDLS